MTREALYVLATRARERTTFYVATHDLPFDEDARVDQVRYDPRQYAAREVLLNILATEGAPLSATETIAAAQEEAGSLATLVPRYLHAAHQDADARYRAAAVAALGDGRRARARRRPGLGRGRPPAVRRRRRRLGPRPAARHRRRPARTRQRRQRRRSPRLADRRLPRRQPRAATACGISPEPPCPADGSMPRSAHARPTRAPAQARERLAALAVATLGARARRRAQAETAWPALIAALRRAENAGYDPADALTRRDRPGAAHRPQHQRSPRLAHQPPPRRTAAGRHGRRRTTPDDHGERAAHDAVHRAG